MSTRAQNTPAAERPIVTIQFNNQPIQVFQEVGVLWVEVKAVASILGYRSPDDMLKMVDRQQVRKKSRQTPRGKKRVNFTSEAGLYTAIFNSERPEAKEFSRWVTHTVLPEIRRTGSFAALGDESVTPPDIVGLIKAALQTREDGAYVCGMINGEFRIVDWEKYSFLTVIDRTIFDLIYLSISRALAHFTDDVIAEYVPPDAPGLKAITMLIMTASRVLLPGLKDVVSRCVLLHSDRAKEMDALKTRYRFEHREEEFPEFREDVAIVRLKQGGFIKPDDSGEYVLDRERLIAFEVEVSKLQEAIKGTAKLLGGPIVDTSVEMVGNKRRIVDLSPHQIRKFQFESVMLETFEDRGLLWMAAESIATAIGHSNHSVMAKMADRDDVRYEYFPTEGGHQRIQFISESGLYRIALKTTLPSAARFRDWVTGTVLPEIRRTGRFHGPSGRAPLIEGPRDPMRLAKLLMEGREDDLYIASKKDGALDVTHWRGIGFISPRVEGVAAMSIIHASEVLLMYGSAGVLRYLPGDHDVVDEIFKFDIPLAKFLISVSGYLLEQTVLPSGRLAKKLRQTLYDAPTPIPLDETDGEPTVTGTSVEQPDQNPKSIDPAGDNAADTGSKQNTTERPEGDKEAES